MKCMAYTNPLLPPLKIYFTPIKGAGAWALVAITVSVTVEQPGFVNGGPKQGSESTERGTPPPTVYREIFCC